jgi:pantoate--beta-alanine ligase
MLPVFRTVAALRAQSDAWRKEGLRIALVPTMGALHDGHLSLIRAAKERADKVLASIFVNPTQFGPKEDFAAYPRQEEQDLAKLESAGTDGAYLPGIGEIYPPGFATSITVGGVSEGLCGAVRPGHFAGVATVVAKLLLQSSADIALFGEKDYQQLQVIRRMARDLDLRVAIEGVPTMREPDGLAMSSRNAYLSPEERAIAPALYRELMGILAELRQGADAAQSLAAGIRRILEAGFSSVDYLELRAAEDLAPLVRFDRPARLLVAARLGKTRLIDNIPAPPA